MNPELLNKIADIINANSNTFYAVVPRMKCEYLEVAKTSLTKTLCYVLNIVRLHQAPNSKRRKVWNIYEIDIDNTIKKISHRDRSFASRISDCSITPLDVEIIIRRASFHSLKLKIALTALDINKSQN